MPHFTLEDSLKIQEQDLKDWETVLKPDVFVVIKQIVLARNKGVTNPYQICRGGEISCIISNVATGNLELYS